MNADSRRQELDEITRRVIGCAFRVGNGLGIGYLEKVYENALAVELEMEGLQAVQQAPIQVQYRGRVVGDYAADILVEDSVILELKVAKQLDEVHKAQCLNYLRATGKTVCLLTNFGRPDVEIRRIVQGF